MSNLGISGPSLLDQGEVEVEGLSPAPVFVTDPTSRDTFFVSTIAAYVGDGGVEGSGEQFGIGLAAGAGGVRMMLALRPSNTSLTPVRRTRIVTGLVALIVCLALVTLGAWSSVLGVVLGAVVGVGVIGHRFTSTDYAGDRSKQARRFLARTRRAALQIVGIGVALIIVGVWLWPVQILRLFWITQWATSLPIATAAATAGRRSNRGTHGRSRPSSGLSMR